MSDGKALIVAGAAQMIATRMAVEEALEVGIDLASRADWTAYYIQEPPPVREVRETFKRFDLSKRTHPTSPKPSKHLNKIKAARKQRSRK